MTRNKVKLTYITNDCARRNTFRKRKKGFLKKAHELSTLCAVDLCAIIYSPYDFEPEVWPSHGGVQKVLSKFKQLSEIDKGRKMLNQEGFLRQRIVKASEQLKKQCRENHEMEMTNAMFQSLGRAGDVQGLNMMDLNEMGWMIERNLENVQKRIDMINRATPFLSQGYSPAAAPATATAALSNPHGSGHGDKMQAEQQQWVMDNMMNLENQGMGFGGDGIMHPYGYYINYNNVPWSNNFLS